MNRKKEKGVKNYEKINHYLIVILVLVVVIGIALVGGYNKMVSQRESVDTASANLDVMLQRRADLIPNLVNTVKGYTSHENEVIEQITTARENLINANNMEEKATADEELSSAIDALMIIVENYPDLKSSQNFIQLSDELAGTENRIATARRDYNNAVQTYNLTIRRFPNNLLAGMFGFETVEYFEATESSQEVPNVSFE